MVTAKLKKGEGLSVCSIAPSFLANGVVKILAWFEDVMLYFFLNMISGWESQIFMNN